MAEFDDIDRGWDDLLGGSEEEATPEAPTAAVAVAEAEPEPQRVEEAVEASVAEAERRDDEEASVPMRAVEEAERTEIEDEEASVPMRVVERADVEDEEPSAPTRAVEEDERTEIEDEEASVPMRVVERADVDDDDASGPMRAEEDERTDVEDEDASGPVQPEDERTGVDEPVVWRSPAPAFEAADLDDEPPRRRVPAWTFAALGVPIVALIWYVGAARDPEPTTARAPAVVEERAAGSAGSAEAKRESPTREAAEPDRPSPEADAKPETSKPETSKPEAAAPTFDAGAIGEHAAAYEAAQEQYRTTKSPESLEAMGVAACQMDDGAKARSTYRKMRDRDGRRNVFEACRATDIDLRWSGDGYTPGEQLRRAARALDGGDAKEALELARASNNDTRSNAAILVMGRAHCALGQPGHAERLLPHLGKSSRETLHDACSKSGHDVGP